MDYRKNYRPNNEKTANFDKIVNQTFNKTFTDKTYVDEAKKVIEIFKAEHFTITYQVGKKTKSENLTNTQIRNILAMTSSVYDEANNNGFEHVVDRLAYLKVQLIYQSGRNKAVEAFVKVASLIELLDMINDFSDIKDLLRFCRYMEALVAYFKYYGGKD